VKPVEIKKTVEQKPV